MARFAQLGYVAFVNVAVVVAVAAFVVVVAVAKQQAAEQWVAVNPLAMAIELVIGIERMR